ncbi:30S ribosomal protein S7 [Candidatus Pacearchaeota archaeon]|jgi:small subunit ribosomal protein S7|nr:30S ribosomal protein S7 [Candidatus Pacearchaeota archaeon]
MAEQEALQVFDRFDGSKIEIKDPAMVPYLGLDGIIVAKTFGRPQQAKFGKAKTHILERLANRLAVPGHVGKKHKIMTSWGTGKWNKNMKLVLDAMALIAEKTGKDPLQVLVTAIENGSPRDEITILEIAGARYPQAVDCAPLRRVDLALRWFVQGAYGKSFGKKTKMVQALANEIMLAADGNMESFSLMKKNDAEKQADSAR